MFEGGAGAESTIVRNHVRKYVADFRTHSWTTSQNLTFLQAWPKFRCIRRHECEV